jgi:hypothetical protein
MAMLGVGPKPLPYRRLTTDRLAAAVAAAVGPGPHHERAAWVAARIAEEDGAGHIAAAVDKPADWPGRVGRMP